MSFQQNILETHQFPSTGWLEIDLETYEGIYFSLCETKFSVLARKENGIGIKSLYKSIQLVWPIWQEIFPVPVPRITIVDANYPLGGGVLDQYAVGIYLGDFEFDENTKNYLYNTLSWDHQNTAKDYIKSCYSNFSDPFEAYVTNQVIHELGHIYFLNGIRKISPNSQSAPQTWFGLGLGIVYDEILWMKIYKNTSPKLDAYVETYTKKYLNRRDLDQRLIKSNDSTENISKDKKEKSSQNNLIQLQMFDHIKSFLFLKDFRKNIGEKIFDNKVLSYLKDSSNSEVSYEDFLSNFNSTDLALIKKIENKHLIR